MASDNAEITRTWQCMCGQIKCQVTGDPVMACWCHCKECRQQAGSAMQKGIFKDIRIIINGPSNMIKYESSPGSFRNSCGVCGSFCYKEKKDGKFVVPLGAMDGPAIKPTCNIFVADRGNQAIIDPSLDQYDGFPE